MWRAKLTIVEMVRERHHVHRHRAPVGTVEHPFRCPLGVKGHFPRCLEGKSVEEDQAGLVGQRAGL